ncbi:hypothetical protein M404DRAFT_32813 [Pisolithus tinctorius Marx 270]|uniref:Uncharacterized protein n=1 Tax=Pisolithus tinctorius Marx 270 TaxID=870435 RepID=A0A0C3IIR1_PISTI|nr:hypothetical protein M404DRAFT_32813 [Pisolithus tinctorius Marx 270]
MASPGFTAQTRQLRSPCGPGFPGLDLLTPVPLFVPAFPTSGLLYDRSPEFQSSLLH